MRRIILTALTVFACTSWAHAKAVTPAEARALAVDAEQTLVQLNNYLMDEYYHRGEFDNCVVVIDRVVTLDPIGTEPYAIAAWLLWSSGKVDEAVAYNDRMVAANPDDPMAHFEVGAFYVRMKKDREAVGWLERAEALGRLPYPHRNLLGYVLERLGRIDDAIAHWRRILEDDPDHDVANRKIPELERKKAATPGNAAAEASDK